MSNDPTTTPSGESDMPSTGAKSSRSRSNVRHPGMMGDGTEEQNLGEIGDPSARIGQDEVQQAFGGSQGAGSLASSALKEPRSFIDKDAAMEMAGKAKDAAAETMTALTGKVNAMRDQMQQSADAAKDWAMKQADAAKQLHAEKPVLVLSASAGAALAIGLLAGFVIGRVTADDY